MATPWRCAVCQQTFPDAGRAGAHSRAQGHWVERVELRPGNAPPKEIPVITKSTGGDR